MKKREFKTLALMGLTSGLLLSSQASANQGLSDQGLLLAASTQKAKCPGKNGCPGITASRDNSSKTAYQDPSKASTKSSDNSNSDGANGSNLGYHLMTEDELLLELNDEGSRMYKSLSPEGKRLALEVASMRCAKTNPCAGLNACATDKNDCAGKGQCKARGKCAVSDKNLAVKLVYEKMVKKRSDALRSNY